MLSCLVYFVVSCKRLVGIVTWIVCMVVAVLCVWTSYVYCGHIMYMCGLLMCISFVECTDVLL
jgi:hypothetical protein